MIIGLKKEELELFEKLRKDGLSDITAISYVVDVYSATLTEIDEEVEHVRIL